MKTRTDGLSSSGLRPAGILNGSLLTAATEGVDLPAISFQVQSGHKDIHTVPTLTSPPCSPNAVFMIVWEVLGATLFLSQSPGHLWLP